MISCATRSWLAVMFVRRSATQIVCTTLFTVENHVPDQQRAAITNVHTNVGTHVTKSATHPGSSARVAHVIKKIHRKEDDADNERLRMVLAATEMAMNGTV